MKLIDYLDGGARHFPHRTCFQHDDGGHAYSYSEVAELTRRIGNGMLAVGVRDSDTFAVYSPNHSLGLIAILGGLRIGAKWININARNSLEDNLHCLNLNECAFLFYHSSLEHMLQAILSEVPTLKGVVRIDDAGASAAGLLEWAQHHEAVMSDLAMGDEEIAAHFSTGGTTGRPKAALLSNRALTSMVTGFLSYLHFDFCPTYLLIAPMTHAAGVLTFPLLSLGATTVIMPEVKPARILENLDAHKINVVFLPPTLIYMLLAQPNIKDFDYSALKYFIYAAAPMAPNKLIEAIRIFGPVMMQTYGQVEAPMLLSCFTPQEHAEALADPNKQHRLASCGRQSHVARIEIMDSDGTILETGERGEIVCRGSLVMSGYHKSPQETETASRYGWHHTGDVGYRAEDGYIYIVDRIKDMIISGGFNIYPSEIEAFLLSLPQVKDCAVIGIPDEKWGEAVTAVLELKPECQIDERDVIAKCKEKLGSIKAPKSIKVWATLPRSAVGKVLKREVRKTFWQDAGRAI